MRNCFAIITALAVASCASMTPEAEKVMLHSSSSTIVGDCSRLGSVQGEASLWELATKEEGFKQAKINLRESAYRQYQADTVVLVNFDQLPNDIYTTRIIAHGVAFKCNA